MARSPVSYGCLISHVLMAIYRVAGPPSGVDRPARSPPICYREGMPHRLFATVSSTQNVLRHEEIEALLAPWLHDRTDRAFVARCLVDEGPIHHRGATYALLRLIGLALAAVGGPGDVRDESAPIPLRLPPHLRRRGDDGDFPLGVPLEAIERLAPRGSPEFTALLDCLRDGPPHHALANAAMVCMLGALLDRLPGAQTT
jgi:hypothetical protein